MAWAVYFATIDDFDSVVWPFRRKSPQATQTTVSIDKSVSGIVSIESLDFVGTSSESPDGRFTIAFSNTFGSYVLAKSGIVICQGKLERPWDGHVANNGTFVIVDWLLGSGLESEFWAFDLAGGILFRQRFQANAVNAGISDSGDYAVIQLSNSETADGGKLMFVDLRRQAILWQKRPESRWASSYVFDDKAQTLGLVYRDCGAYKYSYEGEFIDATRWRDERIIFASVFELILIAKDEMSSPHPNLSRVLQLVDRAFQKDLADHRQELAYAYRLLGEVQECRGVFQGAMDNYERALSINPKVGVKRRLATLKKREN